MMPNSDLAIHELCRMATIPTSVRFSKDEISDDEEDEDGDENSNDTEVELDQIFDACELEEGTKMHEVTQFMINISHSMGPVKVPTPPSDDDENDTTDTAANNNLDAIETGNNENNNIDNLNSSHRKASANTFTLHKSILTYADSMGKTPLHILCESSCDSSMLQVILGSTREATGDPNAPTAFSLILAKDSRGSIPLHYMSYNRQCPFSSLKLMMDYCKPRLTTINNETEERWIDPTLCTDHDGETPLHWALAGYVSSRRIKELTRHSVDAIMVENQKGEKPFDQFTSNFVDSDWTDHDVCGNEVWENIQEYLKCIHDNQLDKSTNSNKMNEGDSSDSDESNRIVSEWRPLHFLAGSEYEFPAIFADLALKYCSQDLSKPDDNGMLPLHLACARTLRHTSNAKPTKDLLALKILRKYLRGSRLQARSTKRLPLHFAVDSQKPLSVITALVRTYPRSLNIPDPVTKLWPYVLAGVENINSQGNDRTNESLSVSFALLRADPSVLHLVRKNEFGNLTDKEKLRFAEQNDEEDYMEHNSRRIRRLTIRDD